MSRYTVIQWNIIQCEKEMSTQVMKIHRGIEMTMCVSFLEIFFTKSSQTYGTISLVFNTLNFQELILLQLLFLYSYHSEK